MCQSKPGADADAAGLGTGLAAGPGLAVLQGGVVAGAANMQGLCLTHPVALGHEEGGQIGDAEQVHEQVGADRTVASESGWFHIWHRGRLSVGMLAGGFDVVGRSGDGVGVNDH